MEERGDGSVAMDDGVYVLSVVVYVEILAIHGGGECRH